MMLLKIKNCFFSVPRLGILFFERKLVNLKAVEKTQEKELLFCCGGLSLVLYFYMPVATQASFYS